MSYSNVGGLILEQMGHSNYKLIDRFCKYHKIIKDLNQSQLAATLIIKKYSKCLCKVITPMPASMLSFNSTNRQISDPCFSLMQNHRPEWKHDLLIGFDRKLSIIASSLSPHICRRISGVFSYKNKTQPA